jgi:hypothetical protein
MNHPSGWQDFFQALGTLLDRLGVNPPEWLIRAVGVGFVALVLAVFLCSLVEDLRERGILKSHKRQGENQDEEYSKPWVGKWPH